MMEPSTSSWMVWDQVNWWVAKCWELPRWATSSYRCAIKKAVWRWRSYGPGAYRYVRISDIWKNLLITRLISISQQKAQSKMLPAPYVKVYLVSGKRCVDKMKTSSARRTLDPLYQQQLVFKQSYTGCILQVGLLYFPIFHIQLIYVT